MSFNTNAVNINATHIHKTSNMLKTTPTFSNALFILSSFLLARVIGAGGGHIIHSAFQKRSVCEVRLLSLMLDNKLARLCILFAK